MGSVPWDCDMCQQTHLGDPYMNRARASTHLEVLLGSLLPLLGHGARPDGAGEHAGEGEDGEGTGDDGERDEQNLAALIRRRGTAGAVGTEGDEVGYHKKSLLACGSYRRCCMRGGGCAGCHGPTRMCPYQPRVRHTPGHEAQWLCRRVLRTSLLLLHGQLLPVSLHAVPQRHPEVGLLLGGLLAVSDVPRLAMSQNLQDPPSAVRCSRV